MQARERQLHLGLDARDLGHSEAASLPSGVREERRLPDPGLAPYEEDRALAPSSSLKQPVQRIALPGPAQKRRRSLDDAPLAAAGAAKVDQLADHCFRGVRSTRERLGKVAHRATTAGSARSGLQ
jgi:hypothetical protein